MSEAKLDRASQALIGMKLRSMYDDLPDEPIPDGLLRLIRELEETEVSLGMPEVNPVPLEPMLRDASGGDIALVS